MRVPSGRLGEVGRSSWKARRGRKAHPEGREGSGGRREWTGVLPGRPEGVVSPTRWARRIGRPTSRAAWGREALPVGRQWLGSPPRELGMVSNPSQRVVRCREALLEGL